MMLSSELYRLSKFIEELRDIQSKHGVLLIGIDNMLNFTFLTDPKVCIAYNDKNHAIENYTKETK